MKIVRCMELSLPVRWIRGATLQYLMRKPIPNIGRHRIPRVAPYSPYPHPCGTGPSPDRDGFVNDRRGTPRDRVFNFQYMSQGRVGGNPDGTLSRSDAVSSRCNFLSPTRGPMRDDNAGEKSPLRTAHDSDLSVKPGRRILLRRKNSRVITWLSLNCEHQRIPFVAA